MGRHNFTIIEKPRQQGVTAEIFNQVIDVVLDTGEPVFFVLGKVSQLEIDNTRDKLKQTILARTATPIEIFTSSDPNGLTGLIVRRYV